MKNVKITEKLFKAVKIMLEGGATYEEVKDYLGVSLQTCARIKHSENYADYKNILAAMAVKNKGYKQAKANPKPVEEKPVEKPVEENPVQVVEHRQNVTIQATHYMMQEMQKTNELLKEISNKLAFIVEQLA